MNSQWLTLLLVVLIMGFGIFYWQNKEAGAPTELDEFIEDDFELSDTSLPAVDKNDVSNTISDSSSVVVEEDALLTDDDIDDDVPSFSGADTSQLSLPEGQTFTFYTNKAIGYDVELPDKWYWQHFNAAELKESAPEVIDYLIIDRQPLRPLGSEDLGEIVIEVSKKGLTEFTQLDSYSRGQEEVGGESATRYKKVSGNQTFIEYHFLKNGLTFRILSSPPAQSEPAAAIFARVVSSFQFN